MGFWNFLKKSDSTKRNHLTEENPRRSPRIRLTLGQKLSLKITSVTESFTVQVDNISRIGVGLKAKDWPGYPQQTEQYDGLLILDNKELPIHLHIVRNHGGIIGCEFISPLPEITSFLSNQFDLEFKALNLVRINPDLLGQNEEGVPWWFKDETANEVFLIENDNLTITRFFICFKEHYLEWNKKDGLRYAHLDEDLATDHVKASTILKFADEIPSEIIENAIRFTSNIVMMPRRQLRHINDLLTKAR